jgi:hypothetical protein
MTYLYRKGRIVTITWKHGGHICKILARPGQIVYDTITQFIRTLEENEYVVYYKDLRIEHSDYLVAQYDTKPIGGILVNDIHLVPSSKYEKQLRRIGIAKSPYYDTMEPEGVLHEIIVFKKLTYPFNKPRMLRIKNICNAQNAPLYTLSNGETIERGSLKLFYRQPIEYEKTIYQKKENYIAKNTSCIGSTA